MSNVINLFECKAKKELLKANVEMFGYNKRLSLDEISNEIDEENAIVMDFTSSANDDLSW